MHASDFRDFDLVIFGASGLTGRYATEELSQCVADYPGFKWAVAGRSIEKLKRVLADVQDILPEGLDIRNTPIIKADAEDPSSIEDMCKKTKLLLNCVGPYNLYGGELIVSTCIKCRTHCIDISAEIKYLDSVQAKYFAAARKAGVYLVEACGLGSLPTDYGIAILMKKFPSGLNSVEYFVEFLDGPQGRPTGYGTFSSFVHSIMDYFKSSEFEKQVVEEVFRKKLVESNFTMNKLIKKSLVLYSRKERALCVKYVGPDVRTIKRSQMFRANFLNRDTHIETNGWLKPKSLSAGLLYLCVSIIAAFMCLFATGRSLLEKYPSFFTAGIFTKTGPTRQQILESSTRITFYAKGWKNEGNEFIKKTTKPDKKIKMIITAQEPAYAFTAVCMIQASLAVLFEPEKIPLEGGVYTPGVAFEDTSMKERLEKRGVTFTFEEIK